MAGEATKAIDPKELWGGGRSPFSISYGKMMMWLFLISDALTFGGFLGAVGFMRHKYADVWPVSEDVFYHFPFVPHHIELPLLYVAFMTFILIVSSVTMVLAVEAGHRMDRKGVTKWLLYTVIGGVIFLGSQAWEWATFIHGSDHGAYVMANGKTAALHFTEDGQEYLKIEGEKVFGERVAEVKKHNELVHGANLVRNEYGHKLYANFFFFVTGFHGTHVLSGVIINIIILLNVIKGVYDKRGHYEMVEKVGLYWHFIDLVWVFVFTFFYLI